MISWTGFELFCFLLHAVLITLLFLLLEDCVCEPGLVVVRWAKYLTCESPETKLGLASALINIHS